MIFHDAAVKFMRLLPNDMRRCNVGKIGEVFVSFTYTPINFDMTLRELAKFGVKIEFSEPKKSPKTPIEAVKMVHNWTLVSDVAIEGWPK